MGHWKGIAKEIILHKLKQTTIEISIRISCFSQYAFLLLIKISVVSVQQRIKIKLLNQYVQRNNYENRWQ